MTEHEEPTVSSEEEFEANQEPKTTTHRTSLSFSSLRLPPRLILRVEEVEQRCEGDRCTFVRRRRISPWHWPEWSRIDCEQWTRMSSLGRDSAGRLWRAAPTRTLPRLDPTCEDRERFDRRRSTLSTTHSTNRSGEISFLVATVRCDILRYTSWPLWSLLVLRASSVCLSSTSNRSILLRRENTPRKKRGPYRFSLSAALLLWSTSFDRMDRGNPRLRRELSARVWLCRDEWYIRECSSIRREECRHEHERCERRHWRPIDLCDSDRIESEDSRSTRDCSARPWIYTARWPNCRRRPTWNSRRRCARTFWTLEWTCRPPDRSEISRRRTKGRPSFVPREVWRYRSCTNQWEHEESDLRSWLIVWTSISRDKSLEEDRCVRQAWWSRPIEWHERSPWALLRRNSLRCSSSRDYERNPQKRERSVEVLVSRHSYFSGHSRNLSTSIRVVLIRLNERNVPSTSESVSETDIEHNTRIGETEGGVIVGERKGIAFLNEGEKVLFPFHRRTNSPTRGEVFEKSADQRRFSG